MSLDFRPYEGPWHLALDDALATAVSKVMVLLEECMFRWGKSWLRRYGTAQVFGRLSHSPGSNMPPSALVFRVAQATDKKNIIMLSREVHEETRSARNREPFHEGKWLWQNWGHSPLSDAVTVAQDGEDICGVFPMPMRMVSVHGVRMKAGVVQGLVSKKTHRRRGVFTQMGRRAMEDAPSRGIDICYSFPNSRSVGGFIGRLGFRLITTVPLHVKPHLTAWPGVLLSKMFENVRRSRTHHEEGFSEARREKGVIRVRNFDSRFQRLWERAQHAQGVSLIRDPAFLNWRFRHQAAPAYHILAFVADEEIESYVVYRFTKILYLPACVVIDFLCAPGAFGSLTALIRHVAEHAGQEGSIITIASFKAKEPFVQTFKKAGFVGLPGLFSIRPLKLVARVTSNWLQEDDIRDSSKWFVTLADWDVL